MLKFKGSWRNYQKRILDNLDYHLSDEKLHIVAAPGAGKTTLGIEVISRINRPSLILCPTNTIKNQWKDRVCSAFLEENEYNLVSTDIRKPAYLTVTTYQALLAAFCEGAAAKEKKEEEILENENDYSVEDDIDEKPSMTSSKRFSPQKADEIIKILKKAKISLLCFDEAHHLRKEWWKALMYLMEELEPKQTVALTATPPYDVDYNEWQRYEELCGPIDEVISIPELVQNDDLCPHQDFIHFSLLKDNEKAMLRKHSRNVREFVNKIFEDEKLFEFLKQMNFLNPTDEDVEKIFDNPDFYVSIASFLNSKGVEIPKAFLKIFGAKKEELPVFDLKQAKAFLNGFLVSNTDLFVGLEEKIEEYRNLAKHLGLMQNKKIILNESAKIQKQMANSLGKLDSIIEIVDIELNSLADKLRMVILADYIKADDVSNSHLGVVPIWRTLKDKYGQKVELAILCGSLIILPKVVEDLLQDLLKENNISPDNIAISSYKEDENYIKVTPKESTKHKIVALITELFNRGSIKILIGTQALLGEGWDAPVINSLILSSTVSSYMLSNQMRGRAIRKDKNNPDKISNIWHLASVSVPNKSDFEGITIFQQTITDSDIQDNSALYDLSQLEKRFDGFEAPSYYGKHEIVSGINRVISDKFYSNILTQKEVAFTNLNKLSIANAKNREQTKAWWNSSLYEGYSKGFMTMHTGVDAPRLTVRTLMYTGYKQAFMSIITLFVAILVYLISNGIFFKMIFLLWFVAFVICMLYVFLKFLKTGSIASIMKQIAIVHLETLSYLGFIKTSLKNIGVHVEDSDYIFLSCKNLPTEENNLLIKSIQEFLDPIDNPRYILTRKNRLGAVIQTDYFAIPSVISSKKKDVEIFQKLWEKHIGACEVTYTRNLEGRKLLLKARKIAFSATKREKSKKLSKWS